VCPRVRATYARVEVLAHACVNLHSIYQRKGDDEDAKRKLAKVYIELGELNIQREAFAQAVEDLQHYIGIVSGACVHATVCRVSMMRLCVRVRVIGHCGLTRAAQPFRRSTSVKLPRDTFLLPAPCTTMSSSRMLRATTSLPALHSR
jgi:hypothetical protein